MPAPGSNALIVEQSCSFLAVALSQGRRHGAVLNTGERRCFGLNASRTQIKVPFPALSEQWNPRSITCGVALQCSPTKDLIAHFPLHGLSTRERAALLLVEGGAAIGWLKKQCPGLLPEFRRLLPGVDVIEDDINVDELITRVELLANSARPLNEYPLLGQLPKAVSMESGLRAALQRMRGRMPWTSKSKLSRGRHTIPVGGDGGIQNPNLPPPSRPENDDIEIRSDQRAGIPYPEWNAWKQRFLPDHVAVLERKLEKSPQQLQPVAANLRRWFEANTHRAMRNRLEDGSDLDVDQYINHYVTVRAGRYSEARVFRELLPANRDVSTALLLDGSSSLGVRQGHIFKLELACADALSQAMTLARERHGLFVFSGNTRHRVDVTCLKDFSDPRLIIPGNLGLLAGGYTRLGAPIRHLTRRLLDQPSERRLLIIMGDGLMSDEGYEGRYAWADVAHAIEESEEAGITIYYIGVGPARVDPLPDVFGQRRSTRIGCLDDLPRVLAHVHRELVAA